MVTVGLFPRDPGGWREGSPCRPGPGTKAVAGAALESVLGTARTCKAGFMETRTLAQQDSAYETGNRRMGHSGEGSQHSPPPRTHGATGPPPVLPGFQGLSGAQRLTWPVASAPSLGPESQHQQPENSARHRRGTRRVTSGLTHTPTHRVLPTPHLALPHPVNVTQDDS